MARAIARLFPDKTGNTPGKEENSPRFAANSRGDEEPQVLIGPAASLQYSPRARYSDANPSSPVTKADSSHPLANAGYNTGEPRLPAGQSGGGRWTKENAEAQNGIGPLKTVPSKIELSGGNGWTPPPETAKVHSGARLTKAQRNLLREKNAQAVAIIAQLGYKGEIPDTPESLLNGPLKTSWGTNVGWIPGTPHWDMRQKYKGFGDHDIALLESTRRNGVRAATLLAKAGKLPNSQVTIMRLHGFGVMGETAMDLGLALAPYESLPDLASAGLLGAVDDIAGTITGKATTTVAEEDATVSKVLRGDQSFGTKQEGSTNPSPIGTPNTSDAPNTKTIPTIGGRRPINSRYAGKMHPAGVQFTPKGFPDFGSHKIVEVELDGLTGDIKADSKLANKAMGYPKTPKGYVWHHVEDSKTMQLIPKDLHRSVPHTGGAAVIRNGGFDQ